MTHVFIISDVPLYRMGLAQVLMFDGRLRVVGSAGDWAEGVRNMRLSGVTTDVLLVDLRLPHAVGRVRAFASASGGIPVVALTNCGGADTVIPWVNSEASGLVSRRASLDEVVGTVESAAQREPPCTPRVTADWLRCLARLTVREREIIGLIDEGLSNKEIARRLRIELPTVKNHVHHILRKLNAHRRGEAAAMLRGDRPQPRVTA